MNVTLTVNGVSFVCSARQASTIETLIETQKGGFAKVRGYVATSNRVKPETFDATVLTRFSTERLYQRKMKALQDITLDDIRDKLIQNPKVKALSEDELKKAFEDRKASTIASLQKTIDGDRSDARRQSHDRNYFTIGEGVKVHFVTEKNTEGVKVPVLNKDGLLTVETIMLSVIEISKETIVEGEYKVVNSGVPVLISNAIETLMPKSTKLKTFSLRDDNFDSIAIDGETIMPKDIAGDFT